MIVYTETFSGKTINIHHDENPASPREWESCGTMVCWHSRYNLGDIDGSREYMIDYNDDTDKMERSASKYISEDKVRKSSSSNIKFLHF